MLTLHLTNNTTRRLKNFLVLLVAIAGINTTLSAQVTGFWPATIYAPNGATNIQWFRDNVAIGGAMATSYSVTQDGTYHATYGSCPSRSTMTITLTPNPSANLSVSVSPLMLTSAEGEVHTFTITVTNAGPDAAPAAEVRVPIPDERDFLTATPSQGTYSPGTEIWQVGNLANGASATLAIHVRVN